MQYKRKRKINKVAIRSLPVYCVQDVTTRVIKKNNPIHPKNVERVWHCKIVLTDMIISDAANNLIICA